MRLRVRTAPALLAAASAVALWPALAQRAPESILPPGFGQAEPAPAPTPPAPGPPPRPSSNEDVPEIALTPPPTAVRGDTIGAVIDTLADNAAVAMIAPPDLPDSARRALDRVGLLDLDDGGFGSAGFGARDGLFLASVMRSIDAPLASRWASILLRRALLSPSTAPPGMNGADFVAERAWLLLRMGEADMARALVSRP